MTPELKAKWVAELRSGKYKQGKDYLKQVDMHGDVRHCCLGVLAELIPGVEWEVDPSRSYQFMRYKGEQAACILPGTLLEETGRLRQMTYDEKTSPNPITDRTCQQVYSQANDEGKTFAEIADMIEASSL